MVVVKVNCPLVDGLFTKVQLFTNCQLLLKLGKFPYSSNKKRTQPSLSPFASQKLFGALGAVCLLAFFNFYKHHVVVVFVNDKLLVLDCK